MINFYLIAVRKRQVKTYYSECDYVKNGLQDVCCDNKAKQRADTGEAAKETRRRTRSRRDQNINVPGSRFSSGQLSRSLSLQLATCDPSGCGSLEVTET